jgi:rhodanese-related sulfurtransferase
MTDEATETTGLEPRPAAELLAGGGVELIDVRQDYEWEASRIPGAKHIPLELLPARASELSRDQPVIFQCRTGARSGMATAALREAGLEAYNLEGGLEAWVAEGLEVEPANADIAHPRPDNS